MPLLCERQQQFKLVDQGDGPRKCGRKGGRPTARNSTDRRPSIRQKRHPRARFHGQFGFHITLFFNLIAGVQSKFTKSAKPAYSTGHKVALSIEPIVV
jgi:hypothetical protein